MQNLVEGAAPEPTARPFVFGPWVSKRPRPLSGAPQDLRCASPARRLDFLREHAKTGGNLAWVWRCSIRRSRDSSTAAHGSCWQSSLRLRAASADRPKLAQADAPRKHHAPAPPACEGSPSRWSAATRAPACRHRVPPPGAAFIRLQRLQAASIVSNRAATRPNSTTQGPAVVDHWRRLSRLLIGGSELWIISVWKPFQRFQRSTDGSVSTLVPVGASGARTACRRPHTLLA